MSKRTINGERMEFLCEPQQSMLDVLRDNLRLTGTKEGCATGDCGACSVLLDGRCVFVPDARGRKRRASDHDDRRHLARRRRCIRSSRSSSNTPRCNAASARRVSSSRRKRCSTRIRIRRRKRSAITWRAISVVVPVTTRSSVRSKTPRKRCEEKHLERSERLQGHRHARRPSGRRRQGHRPRELRRGLQSAGHAVRQGAAQPARARADQEASTPPPPKRSKASMPLRPAPIFRKVGHEEITGGEGAGDFADLATNVMARDKVVYHGHAVAAVAAKSSAIADAALAAIKVEYEVLTPVMDLDTAMADDATLIDEQAVYRRLAGKANEAEQRRGLHGIQARRRRSRASRKPTSSSRAPIARRRCTRATSSRTPALRRSIRVDRRRSGAARRVTSTCVR